MTNSRPAEFLRIQLRRCFNMLLFASLTVSGSAITRAAEAVPQRVAELIRRAGNADQDAARLKILEELAQPFVVVHDRHRRPGRLRLFPAGSRPLAHAAEGDRRAGHRSRHRSLHRRAVPLRYQTAEAGGRTLFARAGPLHVGVDRAARRPGHFLAKHVHGRRSQSAS